MEVIRSQPHKFYWRKYNAKQSTWECNWNKEFSHVQIIGRWTSRFCCIWYELRQCYPTNSWLHWLKNFFWYALQVLKKRHSLCKNKVISKYIYNFRLRSLDKILGWSGGRFNAIQNPSISDLLCALLFALHIFDIFRKPSKARTNIQLTSGDVPCASIQSCPFHFSILLQRAVTPLLW